MTQREAWASGIAFPAQMQGGESGLRGIWLASGGLKVLSVVAAFALTVLLPPGGSLPVPATTAAAEPDLSGIVIHDSLVPFAIRGLASDTVVCSGTLQDRVVRSSKSGHVHFYYRIRNTTGTGVVNRIATSSFAGLALRVAFRQDGLGTVPPRMAARNVAPGTFVTFEFDPPLSCGRHQESRFMLIKTAANAFHPGGQTQILANGGLPDTVNTVMP
jgi:hypothetical protein